MDDTDDRLIIEIKNSRPVELADFTTSLNALADQYSRFTERNDGGGAAGTLYIHEIRTGSIIAELQPLAEQLPIFAGAAVSVLEFTRDLRAIYDFFLWGKGPDPQRGRQEYKNCSGILNPIARDHASQINFMVGTLDLKVEYSLDATQSAAIQKRIENHTARMAAPVTGVQTQQVFYWYQARDDFQSGTGDRGVIEAIDQRPKKVIFSSEDTKRKMLDGPLFQQIYIVDVEVSTVNGLPKVYKILDVHEVFPKDE